MRTPQELLHSDSLEDQVQGALLVFSYLTAAHGPVYAPLVDRLERELEAIRQKDPAQRARRILEGYALSIEGMAATPMAKRKRVA